MLTGTITLITSDQKYGNVRGDDGITRIFERPEQSLFELLNEGDQVMFVPHRSDKGPAAADLSLVPCPHCKQVIHTSAHLSVCPLRPPGAPPPLQAVKQMPARVGEMMIRFVPFTSQPERGRFYVTGLNNEERGVFDRYENAVAFALGKEP
jgi:hypothetical protein